MTVQQLLDALRKGLAAGSLDPEALVVRPACCCDEDYGYWEARFLDAIPLRRVDLGPDPDGSHGPDRSLYRHIRRDAGPQGGLFFTAADGTHPDDRKILKLD